MNSQYGSIVDGHIVNAKALIDISYQTAGVLNLTSRSTGAIKAGSQVVGKLPLATIPSSGFMFTYCQFVDNEVPVGPIDGINNTFTLANVPNPPDSLQLFNSGGMKLRANGVDFTLQSNSIIYETGAIPQVGTQPHECSYRY